jgi:hypothetical protein
METLAALALPALWAVGTTLSRIFGHAIDHPGGRIDRVLVCLFAPTLRRRRERNKRPGDGLGPAALQRHRAQARWN